MRVRRAASAGSATGNRVHRRRLPQFVLEENAKRMAGPIVSHVGTLLHGVPRFDDMRNKNAKTKKKNSMFLRGGIC